MSHVATIELEILDLDALAEACESLGLELIRGQKTYRWYGQSIGDTKLPRGYQVQDLGKCEHAIRVKGNPRAYEIGLATSRSGGRGFDLLWDTWSGGYGLVEKTGANAQKLRQAYAVSVASKAARRAGYRIHGHTTRADGSVVIRASR